jgi:hypothetical protein
VEEEVLFSMPFGVGDELVTFKLLARQPVGVAAQEFCAAAQRALGRQRQRQRQRQRGGEGGGSEGRQPQQQHGAAPTAGAGGAGPGAGADLGLGALLADERLCVVTVGEIAQEYAAADADLAPNKEQAASRNVYDVVGGDTQP